MFEELPTELSTTLSVVSLLFFVVVYIVVSVRALRHGADELEARARMALDAPAPTLRPSGEATDRPRRDSVAVRG